MNCRDVDRALIELEESPAISFPPEAQEHVRSCRRCQGLVDALNISIDPGSASPATLRQIERAMVADFLPVRPVAPAARRFAVFGGIFGCFVAFGVYRMGAFAIAVMSPLQAWAILSALAISAGLMAYSLANQMVPGSRHRIPPRPLAGGILISQAVAIVLLFQFQHEADFWTGNWACISAGTPFSRAGSHTVVARAAPRCRPFSEHDRCRNRTASGSRWHQRIGDSLSQSGCRAHFGSASRRFILVCDGRLFDWSRRRNHWETFV